MANFQESIRAKCITYLERAEKLKEGVFFLEKGPSHQPFFSICFFKNAALSSC